MINAGQIRAARALLKWSQADLTAKSGISTSAIANIELEKQQPSTNTLESLEKAFVMAGIVFGADGSINYSKSKILIVDDYIEVLEDAEIELKQGDEIIMHCADESRSSDNVTNKLQSFIDNGIRIRMTCSNQAKTRNFDKSCYRLIDHEYFADSEVITLYKDRAVLHIKGNGGADQFLIIFQENLYQTLYKQFLYWWKRGEKWPE